MEGDKRKLIKFSNYSLCLTLPKWLTRDLGWEKGDVVDLEIDSENAKVIISKGKIKTEAKKSSKKEVGVNKKNTRYRW